MINYHIVTAKSIDFLKSASVAILAKQYLRLMKKQKFLTQNIWFNQECLKQKVTPKFITIKSKSKSPVAEKAIHTAQKVWLKEEVKTLYRKKNVILMYLKVIHSELTYRLHPVEFDLLDDYVRNKISRLIYKKFCIQKKKLTKLVNQKTDNINPHNISPQYSDRVINYSTTSFSKKELNTLSLGPKYSPHIPMKTPLETLVTEVEQALRGIDNTIETKSKISKTLNKYKNSKSNHSDHQTIKSIKNKIKDNNLILTKADKSNATVIISKTDYDSKMQSFIQSELTEIKTNPTLQFQSKTKQFLSDTSSILSNSDKHRLICMNPRAPKLYGLIKNHKENAPVRPVVSYVNSPTHKLAQKVNIIFKNLTKFQPKYSIKNSLELSKILKDRNIPINGTLVSFDVSNMFSNIPVADCKPLILKLLDKSNINAIQKNEIMLALELCLSQNYCQYDNKFFTQNTGLAMGSPLSPLLADIFMSFIEEEIMQSQLSKNYIKFWYRYVDDVLACFTGTQRQLNNFLNYINSIHPNIKFTVETEKDNKINFLDLTLKHNQNKIEFDIFRKPTFTDTTIPNASLSPNTHKLAAYNSMIHRALSLPLSQENLEKEFIAIKTIATNNGFSEPIIQRLISKKQYQLVRNSIYPHIKSYDKKYISLTYYGNVSEKISKILSSHNLKVSFKPQTKLSNLFYNAKDITDKFQTSGVYKLSCPDCNAFYIGQTGRSFEIRYKEHLRSFRLQKTDSTFANHILESEHTFPNLSNLEILHKQEKGFKLNILESIEIFRSNKIPGNYLLNDQLDLFQTDLFNVFNPNPHYTSL